MSMLRHAVFAFSYGALAVAVGLTLPYSVPGMERWTAIGIGALVLVFGAVIHEVVARHYRERALARRLEDMAASRERLQTELIGAKEELRAIHGKLTAGPSAETTLAEVSAEVRMLQGLVNRLTAEREGNAEIARPGQAAGHHAPRSILSTDRLSRDDLIAVVRDAVQHDRIDMVYQPIVGLPHRKPRFFACFARIRTLDGAFLLPSQYRAVAEQAGVSAIIDNLLLFRCIQLIRATVRRHEPVGFFAAIANETLRDTAFMEQFVEFMASNQDLLPHLVLEHHIDDLPELVGPLRPSVERLSQLGVRYALDGVGNLAGINLDLLNRCRIRYVKVEARSLMAQVRAADGGLDLGRVADMLDRGAVDLIVTRIDNEATLLELLDLPVRLGQGLLFGEPKPG